MDQFRFDHLTRMFAASLSRRFGGRSARVTSGSINRTAAARVLLQSDGGDICPERIPNPSHTPSFNGCGPEDGIKVPDRIWGANFGPVCDNHDICYDTCNNDRLDCDETFCSGLTDVCRAAGLLHEVLTGCRRYAGIYCTAVTLGGKSAYAAAQQQACDCCADGEKTCGTPPATCCKPDETCCDGTCCPAGQQCCNGECKSSCGGQPQYYCPCSNQCHSTVTACESDCTGRGLSCNQSCRSPHPGECG